MNILFVKNNKQPRLKMFDIVNKAFLTAAILQTISASMLSS